MRVPRRTADAGYRDVMSGFTRSVKVGREIRAPLTAFLHAPPRPDICVLPEPENDTQKRCACPVGARRSALQQRLSNETILAPLTRGGSLPFRRLAVAHGATATMGEMIFARTLIKRKRGDTTERARLRRASGEPFGVQIATNSIGEGRAAIEEAHAAG